MCLITTRECGFVFTPTQAAGKWQWSDESRRFWHDTRRLSPRKNSSVTLVTVPLVTLLPVLTAVPVTVMLQKKKKNPKNRRPRSLFPWIFLTGTPSVLYTMKSLCFVHVLMLENCSKCYFQTTSCWERLCFCHVMHPWVSSLLSPYVYRTICFCNSLSAGVW